LDSEKTIKKWVEKFSFCTSYYCLPRIHQTNVILNPKPLSNTPTVIYKFPFSSIEEEEKPENKKIVKKKKKRDLYKTFMICPPNC
jgi:hypothetical protein